MSFENLTSDSKVLREGVPFTQISNKVINNIKNGDAFLVWCYLYSKTSNWKVVKQNIKNIYGFGQDKIKKIFSYLNRSNLISYTRKTGSNGQFEPVQIKVLNGCDFDINQQFNQGSTTGVKNHRVEKHSSGNEQLLNKEVTKERYKQNKDKNYSSPAEPLPVDKSSSGEQSIEPTEFSFFDVFWSLYPRKQKKKESERLWKRLKCEEMASVILEDVKKRLLTEWKDKDKQYIPLPSTYLNGERWNDEIIVSSKKEHYVTRAMRFCMAQQS